MIEQILDHVQQALNRLLEQYKKKVKVEALVSQQAERVQELENMLFDFIDARNLETAEGVNLDRIGEIVGIKRMAGVSDEAYRVEIKAKIIQNLNSGTSEQVIQAAIYFLGTSNVEYYELFAGVEIFTTVEVDALLTSKISAALNSFLPAGVSLDTFAYYDPIEGFLFDISPLGDTDDPLIGGLLADNY